MKKEYIVLLVAAALFAVWYFFFRDKSTVAANAVINTGAPVAAPAVQPPASIGLPSINNTPAFMATAPAPSQSLVTTAPRPGVAVTFDSTILPWMNNLGVANKQQALKMYPSMTTAEKTALSDIILNVWTGKRPQTKADTDFWNTWRVKYHIEDGTFNPYV